jgi:hypothetical protein
MLRELSTNFAGSERIHLGSLDPLPNRIAAFVDVESEAAKLLLNLEHLK